MGVGATDENLHIQEETVNMVTPLNPPHCKIRSTNATGQGADGDPQDWQREAKQ